MSLYTTSFLDIGYLIHLIFLFSNNICLIRIIYPCLLIRPYRCVTFLKPSSQPKTSPCFCNFYSSFKYDSILSSSLIFFINTSPLSQFSCIYYKLVMDSHFKSPLIFLGLFLFPFHFSPSIIHPCYNHIIPTLCTSAYTTMTSGIKGIKSSSTNNRFNWSLSPSLVYHKIHSYFKYHFDISWFFSSSIEFFNINDPSLLEPSHTTPMPKCLH